jgi:hypothetical protein
MRSTGQFLMFLAIAFSVVGGWQYYLWVRMVRDPGWPEPYGRIATALLVFLSTAPLVVIFTARFMSRSALKALSASFYTWFGLAFLLTVALFAGDLARWIVRAVLSLAGNAGPEDPERRQLVARGVAGAAGATAALAEVEVKEVGVRLPRLPPALSGLSIVQLTDVHIGPTIGRKFLEHVVDRTNAQKPDVIAITGDLVDGSVAALRAHVEPLARLQARYGVYFVTGNHEYYSGADEWMAELQRLGIRVLHNERVRVGDQASIDLAGVDDPTARGSGFGADYARVFEGVDPERELVLLAHQPSQITHAARAGVGLQLSGHTHGGQIWPFGALVRLNQPYVAGLHQHNLHTQIYVSRGTGYWGPPMRLLCPAEITKVVLAPA